MPYRVEVAAAAQRQIRRLPRSVQLRVEQAVHRLEEAPRPRGSVKLAGWDRVWRVRAGRYRVIYEIYYDDLIVVVLRVVLRAEDTYRRL